MTENKNEAGSRSLAFYHKGVEPYQLVTGNEGPSPLMKRHIESRKKRQKAKPVGADPRIT